MDILSTDLYVLTMSQSFFDNGMHNTMAYFDVFFRRAPDSATFAIANGVAEIIKCLKDFKFSEEDLDYLKSTNMFSAEFIEYLKNLKFTGDLWAVADGTVVFAQEPIITIKAPLIEATLLEAVVLRTFNYASLITTKASRMVRAAKNYKMVEVGARRAQNEISAKLGSLYCYEAGAAGTSCLSTCKQNKLMPFCTMSHAYVQCFDTEYEAFKTYAKANPDNCVLLLDTYNALESGIVNAIKVYDKILKPMGKTIKAVRIDSGDLAYISKEVRAKLNSAGLNKTQIIISNSLDEFVIESLLQQSTPVDIFAVGEKLITAQSCPVFGGVYKLAALEHKGQIIPKIKITDNISKITLPGVKKVYRLYDTNKKFLTDMVTLAEESAPRGKITITDPDRPWMMKDIGKFTVRELRFKFIENGKQVLKCLTPEQIRKNIAYELSTLSPETKRLHNPQAHPINISPALNACKENLLKKRYR